MMRLLLLLLSAPLLLGSLAAAPDAPPVTLAITDREFTDARRTREITALLDQAAKASSPLLVLDINSSSANPELALPLAEHVARLKIRTIAYVNSAAVAGAALLALACDEIWMAPGSRIGAAPPDLATSADLTETAQKARLTKSLAILKAAARSLATLKHHDITLAEGFIDADLTVTIDGKPLTTKGQLLLLDAEQAIAPRPNGAPLLAKGIAPDLPSLATTSLKLTTALTRLEDAPLTASTPADPKKADPKPSPTRQGPFTGKVVRIPVGEEDLISPARFEFMTRTLERCTAEAAEAVIFDLDTPGGLAWDTTNLMMRDLQKLGPPSIAYINPRALSAGAMIAIATDAIYIAPAGSTGAATPIYGTGQEMGDAERAKMNSAMMSMARTVAKEKGHDPRVIEAMIDMDRELIVNGQVLCAKGEILTLDAEEATMISDGKPLFAKAIASTLDDVKTAENLKGATVTAEPLGFERVAILITKYASILILLGIAGAYMEMQAPGFGLPGFVSLIAFSLFFFGHYVAGSLVGHETTFAIAVFIVGIIFVAVELLVFPGTMLPGILGFICIMGALVFTMSGWEIAPIDPTITKDATEATPTRFAFTLSTYATGLRNFAIGITGATALLMLLARYLPQVGPFKHMTLATTAGGSLAETPASLSAAAVRPGDEGIARSALRPYGTIEIAGRQMEATVDSGYLQSGTPIRIREIQGLKIIVEPV